jgi:hypothetical protein
MFKLVVCHPFNLTGYCLMDHKRHSLIPQYLARPSPMLYLHQLLVLLAIRLAVAPRHVLTARSDSELLMRSLLGIMDKIMRNYTVD